MATVIATLQTLSSLIPKIDMFIEDDDPTTRVLIAVRRQLRI
jgi:hypothetical protein